MAFSRTLAARKVMILSTAAMLTAAATAALGAESAQAPAAGTSAAETSPAAATPASSMPALSGMNEGEVSDVPTPPPDAIQKLLQLTERERGILNSVVDGSDATAPDRGKTHDEPAFYMLLSKVAALTQLAPGDPTLRGLDAPSWQNLLRYPQRYRGWPIRMNVQVVLANKVVFNRPPWLRDQTVWQLQCLSADAADPRQEPLIVFTTQDVQKVLGKWERVNDKGEIAYPFTKMAVAGVFYKDLAAEERGSNPAAGNRRGDATRPSRWRLYPIVLAWQLDKSVAKADDKGFASSMLTVGVLLMVAAIGFIFWRMNKMRSRLTAEQQPWRRWRPEQDTASQQPAGDDVGQIDPLLKEAAEQYRKDKEGRNGAKGSG